MKLQIIEKPTKILTPYVRRFGQWLMDISGKKEFANCVEDVA